MEQHTYAQAYADRQAELRVAARRPERPSADPSTGGPWWRRLVSRLR